LFLLVVGFDEPVDQVVDAPGLGEPAFGESVAQFGLGQTLVRFPSLRPVPVNPFPFWLLDIPDRFRSTGGMVDVMFAWSTSFCRPSFQAPATFSVVSRACAAAVMLDSLLVISLSLRSADRCTGSLDHVLPVHQSGMKSS